MRGAGRGTGRGLRTRREEVAGERGPRRPSQRPHDENFSAYHHAPPLAPHTSPPALGTVMGVTSVLLTDMARAGLKGNTGRGCLKKERAR
eukprot:scaffold45595_cov18-Phaeocystis_antarctica.AAC.1